VRLLQPGGGGPPGGGASGGGPSSSTTTDPRAASLLGGVGTTTVAGTDPYWSTISFPSSSTIAGPFEAGFDSLIDTLLGWMGCSPASKGYLDGGIDTQVSAELVAYNCSITLPRVNPDGTFVSLMWSAGAHSPPNTAGCTSPPGSLTGYAACSSPSYHFHQNFTVLYNYGGAATGHSPKIGVTTPSSSSITARSIYGKYEATQALPTDLDACNGHFGLTPDSPTTSVYHHHVTDRQPFAVGCYGPSAAGGLVSITDCRSYYPGCASSNVVTLRSARGWFQYTKWCPCYDNATGSNVYPAPAALYHSTYEHMLAAASSASGSAASGATSTATGTLSFLGLPSSSFTTAGLPTAACLAALTSILQSSISAGGCSACSANITQLADGDTGAVLYSRALAAAPSSLAVTYSVTGPASQLAAVTSSPSAAFRSAVTAAIASTPGYTTITSTLSTGTSATATSSTTMAIGLGVGLGVGIPLLAAVLYFGCKALCPSRPVEDLTKAPQMPPASARV
jgi:hypothetical protein